MTKNTSELSSAGTLPSGPNSPLSKSSLGSPVKLKGSPSVAIAGVDTTPVKPSDQPTLPVAIRISNPKPSSSKAKDKGNAVASPPTYSHDNSYSNYFFDIKNESLFEKYIT